MKRKLCVIVLLALVGVVSADELGAQQVATRPLRHAAADYDFGLYLLGGGHHRDALTLAQMPLREEEYTPAALDSLWHLKGWTYYSLREPSLAADCFARVAAPSPLYAKSAFYGSVCLLEQGRIDGAEEVLGRFAATPQAEHYGELLALQRGGIELLKGDVEAYRTYQRDFSYADFALAEQQAELDRVAATAARQLSPWVAGALSAVVPGLGRIYAGDVGQGIASFLLVGAMVGLTAESWHKAGTPKNWRTVLYGSVGSLLYVSEIFGSAASVRVYYQNFYESRNQAVMYSIHIPLRAIFN